MKDKKMLLPLLASMMAGSGLGLPSFPKPNVISFEEVEEYRKIKQKVSRLSSNNRQRILERVAQAIAKGQLTQEQADGTA